jgi:MFS family permease
MLSLVGTWSHEIARAYLALEIGGTTAALGSLLLSVALPNLVLGLHGGLVADSRDARTVIATTKALLAVSAFGLFLFVRFELVTLHWLYFFAFIEGVLNSYDSPAYTATFQRLIPKEDFKMAVTLQSTNFHMSRMLGPAVAGLIMKFTDTAYVFLFDFLTYLVVIFVILRVQLRNVDRSPSSTNLSALTDGFRYFFGTPTLRYKLLQFLLCLGILMPVVSVVFRSYLKIRFHLDGGEFGLMFSFPAMGAMGAAILFVVANSDDPLKNLRYAVPGLIVTLLAMEHAPSIPVACGLLVLGGFFTYLTVNSITQSMHFEIPDRYRGRLGSIIAMGFTALSALMSFPLAHYTDRFGFARGIRDPLILFSCGSAALALLHWRGRGLGRGLGRGRPL